MSAVGERESSEASKRHIDCDVNVPGCLECLWLLLAAIVDNRADC